MAMASTEFPWESLSDKSNLTQNQTGSNITLKRDEDLARIEIAVQATILFLAVFGNGMVLMVLLCWRSKKLSRMNMMIVHLSCADLFVAFFNVLPQLIWDITATFYGNDFLCRLIKYLQVVAMYASSYVLVSTAIDRYLAICHPLTAHTWSVHKAHLLVAGAWGCSLIFSLPQLVIFSYTWMEAMGYHQCWANFNPEWTLQLYVTWFTVAIYIVPFLILALAYGRICFVVWASIRSKESSVKEHQRKSGSGSHRTSTTNRSSTVENGSLLKNPDAGRHHGKNNEFSNPRAHVRGGMSRAKVKTVKLTLCVIVCYLLCWGPFFVSQMWSAWDYKAPFEGNAAMAVILLLASLNSCTNPWIYLFFIDNICVKTRRFLRTGVSNKNKLTTVFNFGNTMVVLMLLASLNSCTNPWIYLAFSDSLHRHFRSCFGRPVARARTFGETDSRYRSTLHSNTEFTRLESISSGRTSTCKLMNRTSQM